VTLAGRAKAVQDRLLKAHRQQMLDKAPGRDGQVADSSIEPTETTASAAPGPTSSSGPGGVQMKRAGELRRQAERSQRLKRQISDPAAVHAILPCCFTIRMAPGATHVTLC
jgi:hypothetical protein